MKIEGFRMNAIDLEYQCFKCRRAKRDVIITFLRMVEDHPRSLESSLPVHSAFDCSLKAECGIFFQNGDDKLYNWWACLHPDLSKQPASLQRRHSPSWWFS